MKNSFLPLTGINSESLFLYPTLFLFIIFLFIPLETPLAQVTDYPGVEASNTNGFEKSQRSYSGGQFAFVLDGENQGFVKKASGGAIKGEVATHHLGPDLIAKKHITTLSFEPITVEVGLGMGTGLLNWINTSLSRDFSKRNGKFTVSDYNFQTPTVMEFQDALLTEVMIPALGGSSKEPAYMTIKIQPEQVHYLFGDGSQVQMRVPSKKWLVSNFRVEIGDLPCDRVIKIESFTWKLGVAKDEVGHARFPTLYPVKVEIPKIKLTISMADIEPWMELHKCFVIDGNCTDGDELSGSITFLGPDLKEELGRLELSHVGISSISFLNSEQKANKNKEEVAAFEVELYVEALGFFGPEIDDEVLLKKRSKD